MVKCVAWLASHGICNCLGRYGMVYVIVWWGLAWYGLSGMTKYIVWPGEVRHGIWYGLVGMAWYMV